MQREAAEQIGVDIATITNWELGHATPALRWLPGIIQFLGYDPQPQPETVGQALIRHRRGQSMSQLELARILGVDPSTLARWERVERVRTGEFRNRVQDVLRVPQLDHSCEKLCDRR